jgi:alpha-methylacyl-CoA racemase
MATQRPLDGVRILDFTRLLPGAYCTLLLADLGADVVKIEAPTTGDPLRAFGPPRLAGTGPSPGEAGAYFRALNRNKRSVTLDLRAPDARDVIAALAAHADVVVDSFRPVTARHLGLDGASLLAVHPGLVHCAITGFGQSGPYAEMPGHDINYLALSGLLALDHAEGVTPAGAAAVRPHASRAFLADIGGGAMSAAVGILAGLFQRARTGAGSSIDASMHDGMLAWLTFPAAPILAGESAALSDEPPVGRDWACYNVYSTRDDRYVALGALEPKFWERFCDRIGRPDLIAQQFAGGDAQARLCDDVAGIFLTRSRDEWTALFDDTDACLTPVKTVVEALDDPHARARGSVAHLGEARYLRSPVRMSAGTPLRVVALPDVHVAPALGADTDAVLEEAGIGQTSRADLRARGVL